MLLFSILEDGEEIFMKKSTVILIVTMLTLGLGLVILGLKKLNC